MKLCTYYYRLILYYEDEVMQTFSAEDANAQQESAHPVRSVHMH